MTLRTGFSWLALTTGTCAGLVIWHHTSLVRRLGEARHCAIAAHEATTTRLAQARIRLDEIRAARDSLRAERLNTPSTPIATTPAPRRESETYRRMRDDPHIQVLRLQAERAVRAVQYRPLLTRLRLSDSDSDAFDRLIAERDERIADITATASAQNVSAEDPGIRAMLLEVQAASTYALRALLGERAYSVYHDYERTVPIRRSVSGLAATATVAGVPLTPAQMEATVRILAESTPGYRAGQTAIPQAIEWTAAEPLLREILSPAQLEAFLTTESAGPNGGGSRFLPRVHAAIDRARAADAATAAATPRP